MCVCVCVCVCVCARQLLCVVCLFAPRASRLLGRIVLAVHVLLGSRVCACLCFWFCVDAIFVFFSFALDLLLFSVGGEEGVVLIIILLCAEQRARLRLCASLACATWLLFGPVYVVALVRVPAVY